jgi:hypothetical protein
MTEEFYYSSKFIQDEEDKYPAILNERGMVEISEKELKLIRTLFFVARNFAGFYIKEINQGNFVAIPQPPYPVQEEVNDSVANKSTAEKPISITIAPNGHWELKYVQYFPIDTPGEFWYYDEKEKIRIGKVNKKADLDFWLAWYKWFIQRKKMGHSQSLYEEIAHMTGRSVQHIKNSFQLVKGEIDTK